MDNEGRIVKLLAEMLIRQDGMLEELKGVKNEVSSVKNEVSSVKKEVSSLKSEVVKLNLQTSENSRAILKLADRIEQIVDHEKRISKLESMVLK
jgi:archaellum component FlaC